MPVTPVLAFTVSQTKTVADAAVVSVILALGPTVASISDSACRKPDRIRDELEQKIQRPFKTPPSDKLGAL